MSMSVNRIYFCNFCGAKAEDVKHLIATDSVAICTNCILEAVEVAFGLNENQERKIKPLDSHESEKA